MFKYAESQYGYNQILSALAADQVLFNSDYNKTSFIDSIPTFMKLQPDFRPNSKLIQVMTNLVYSGLKPLPCKVEYQNKIKIQLECSICIFAWQLGPIFELPISKLLYCLFYRMIFLRSLRFCTFLLSCQITEIFIEKPTKQWRLRLLLNLTNRFILELFTILKEG
jgi:hypothetical protein